ncbi:LysR family transcriptional regulator [Chromobacterium phragmitis]|uniref:LysR family transcriptional regulator n=1 Tax=Chromobacterium phragmitis TaxID=2202141 RepID=UPI000DED12D3|nr:LysR family transcriptional regulator [Chromobacterium phragmitis]AXE29464.1 LysR family transcriptional regulator [Chromobacterium phragmitis]
MSTPDLNLLITLNALLAEGSVAGAARRLGLSPSAMSRALARLRAAMGDPLLVRAGRGLAPTPRALALRERIGPLLSEAEAALRPARQLDLRSLQRTFTLRTSDGFVENFGPGLIERAAREAPGARFRFALKADKDNAPLRDGSVDLDTGVVGAAAGPELRVRLLFRDRFIGVAREGHPLLDGEISAERYAAARHVCMSRRGQERGPIDEALKALGLRRNAATLVGGFTAALALARATDLVASVPERHTGSLRDGLRSFALPVEVPGLSISMIWHPRQDADPAHQWLRGCVKAACDERLAACGLEDGPGD